MKEDPGQQLGLVGHMAMVTQFSFFIYLHLIARFALYNRPTGQLRYCTYCEHSLDYNPIRKFFINSHHIGRHLGHSTAGLHDDVRVILPVSRK